MVKHQSKPQGYKSEIAPTIDTDYKKTMTERQDKQQTSTKILSFGKLYIYYASYHGNCLMWLGVYVVYRFNY